MSQRPRLQCKSCDEVMSSADSLKHSSTTLQRNCAERPNDATDDIPPAREVESVVASGVAPKRPHQIHDEAMEVYSQGAHTEPSYKVNLYAAHPFAKYMVANRSQNWLTSQPNRFFLLFGQLSCGSSVV
ncbi:hypothetical protein HPB51_003096 [Rhipicephalus microplus]|uniref:Uncharacterized protein n=1 Tax=Rhipicephalus microplus TaxID=6941 RepID=A0A9J6EW72_RHIMP|nr:hypothetical protein HPB51_003096 [Rhipicephalus microplus]